MISIVLISQNWPRKDYYSDTVPLWLDKTKMNVYPVPCSSVEWCLKFEKKITNKQLFIRSIAESSEGIIGISASNDGRIFIITFDPGYTGHAQLLMDIYQKIDNPQLFD
jgi:hypothetical protein